MASQGANRRSGRSPSPRGSGAYPALTQRKDPTWVEIEQPARIERVLRALASEGAVGRLVHAPLAHAALLPVEEQGVLRFHYEGPPLAGGEIELASTHALYRLALGASDGSGTLRMEFPTTLLRRSARRERRVEAPAGVFFCFADAEGFLQRRPVSNVSMHGLGFRPLPRDSVAAGAHFRAPWIDWMGAHRIPVTFTPCATHEAPGTGELVLGGKLVAASADDEVWWEGLVEGLLYPHTLKSGGRAEGLWRLYADSGYLRLSGKQPEDFTPQRDAFRAVQPRLAAASELGIQIVWPSSRGVEAAVTGAVPYAEAAFLYQLARRPGRPPEGTPKQLLREGYMRALEWVQLREDVRWLIIWVQDAGGRISKELHLDFGIRHDDGVTACIRRFHVLELSTTRLPPAAASVRVREAGAADASVVAQRAAEVFPQAYVDAHMLDAERLTAARFPRWDSAGIRRERRVFVAERAGRLVAAAIVTMAEEGVHLFRLFDLVEIVRFGDYDAGAVECLLGEAADWLRSLGVPSFVYACDAEVPRQDWPAGSVDLGLTHCTVLSKALLPELVEDVWLVTAGD